MEAKFAEMDLEQKTFEQISMAITASTADIIEMTERLKQLNEKIEKSDSLYLGCLKHNMKQRLERQLDNHMRLLSKLKASVNQ